MAPVWSARDPCELVRRLKLATKTLGMKVGLLRSTVISKRSSGTMNERTHRQLSRRHPPAENAAHNLLKWVGRIDEKQWVASYEGSLRIPNTHDVVDAVFEIEAETVRVTSGSEVLGSWPLTQVAVEDRGDALLLSLDGEAVLVEIPDRTGFSSALKPVRDRRFRAKKRRRPPRPSKAHSGPPARSPRRRSTPVEHSEPDPIEIVDVAAAEPVEKPNLLDRLRAVASVFNADNWREWLQDPAVRWTMASMGVVVFAMLALFATDTLGMLLVLVGMVALIVAALAASEDINAYRVIPSAISETGLVIGGASSLLIGSLLILLS